MGNRVGSGSLESAPRYRWVIMGLQWALLMGAMWGNLAFSMMLPSMRQELQISPVEIGILSSIGFLLPVFVSVPFGAWIPRFSPKLSTAVTIGISIIALVGQGWAPVFVLLLAGRGLFSLSMFARHSAQTLIIQQWFALREVTRVNSISATVSVVGQIIAMGGTSLLIALFSGWRPVFLLLAAFHVALGIGWLFLGKDRVTAEYRARDSQLKGTPLRALFKYPPIWFAALSMAGGAGAWATFLTFMPTFLTDVRETSLTTAGMLMMVYSFSAFFGTASAGILPDWLGRKKPLLYLSGITLATCYITMVLTPSLFVVGTALFIAGMFAYFVVPILNTIPYELPGITPREVAVGIALFGGITPIGPATLPVVAGLIQQSTGSLQLALGLVGLAPLTLTFFALFLPETGRKGRLARQQEKGQYLQSRLGED